MCWLNIIGTCVDIDIEYDIKPHSNSKFLIYLAMFFLLYNVTLIYLSSVACFLNTVEFCDIGIV